VIVVGHAALGSHAPPHVALRRTQVEGDGSLVVVGKVLSRRGPVHLKLVDAGGGRGLADDIDGPTQGVGPVEDAAGAAHHLHALSLTGVGGGKVAHAKLIVLLRDAVL